LTPASPATDPAPNRTDREYDVKHTAITSRRNRTRAGIAAASVLAVGCLGLAAQPGSAAPSTWAATSTLAFDAAKIGATRLGTATSPSRPMHLAIALTPRHQAAERQAMRAMYTPGSATYHHFLTTDQWNARYAPSSARVSAVRDYLRSQGMHGFHVTGNHLVLSATGTAAQSQRAFHTSLARFSLGGQTFSANTTAAQVPQALAGSVGAVIGLNTFHLATPHPMAHKQAPGSPDPFILLPPKKFQNTYDAQGTSTGTRTAIAIFTEGDMTQVFKDLRTAEAKNNLPQVEYSQIKVGPQSNDNAGLDEWDMDTQVSTAMAQNVKHLYLYTVGALTDSDIIPAFSKFVSQNEATAMSASIGGCDLGPYLDGSILTTDQITIEGSMQGQTLFASSGDNGSGCAYGASVGVPTEPPGTNWPASGEFTTAVGGTSLVVDADGNRAADPILGTPLEYGWIGSGGGISEVENPGWWTADTDPGYNAELVSGGRAVPDISLDADPNVATAASVWVNGAETGVGGTSLSSPLMLGGWARLESGHRNALGLASIGLYGIYDKVNPGEAAGVPNPNPAPVPGFTDITLGGNGHYADTPGYDLVTGLGAPDLAKLNTLLR
jgi:pseudomonalisin